MVDDDSKVAARLCVEREGVEGACSVCGGSTLKRYPVLSEGGWYEVVKCQDCLASTSREPWRLLGPVHLTSEGLELD